MKTPLARSVMAVFVGVVVCVVLIFLLELPGQLIYPMPRDLDVNDREQFGEYVKNAPLAAKLLVLAAYAVGTFVGGWLAARLAGRAPLAHAGVVAAFVLLASLMNLTSMP